MSQKTVEVLENKLVELSSELEERNKDLSVYKEEISRLNHILSEIILGLDRDLDTVRNIFKFLVPTQFPHISGFNFSTKFVPGLRFNGDYVDVFEHYDKFKFNLILSSSTGSALTALLIAFLLKYGREKDGEKAPTPEEFVSKILKEIKTKGQSLADIQLSCLTVDRRTYNLTYKIHGKVFSLFQNGETGEVIELNSVKKESEIKLKSFDRIVLVSPGIVACPNEKGQPFSMTPIVESLASVPRTSSAHDLRNSIFFKLDQHLAGRRPMHDTSLIVMTVDDNVIKLL